MVSFVYSLDYSFVVDDEVVSMVVRVVHLMVEYDTIKKDLMKKKEIQTTMNQYWPIHYQYLNFHIIVISKGYTCI